MKFDWPVWFVGGGTGVHHPNTFDLESQSDALLTWFQLVMIDKQVQLAVVVSFSLLLSFVIFQILNFLFGHSDSNINIHSANRIEYNANVSEIADIAPIAADAEEVDEENEIENEYEPAAAEDEEEEDVGDEEDEEDDDDDDDDGKEEEGKAVAAVAMKELDQFHSTQGPPITDIVAEEGSPTESRDLISVTKKENRDPNVNGLMFSPMQQSAKYIRFERIKRLETDLQNQQTLYHYTQMKLKHKETESQAFEAQKLKTQKRMSELIKEISQLSTKNSQLIKYCESKIHGCRSEYEKLNVKYSLSNKQLLKLQTLLKGETFYKNECTKLRASASALKNTNKQLNEKLRSANVDVRKFKNLIETQKHRLNQNSHQITKLFEDMHNQKNELKRLRTSAMHYRDRILELQELNANICQENKETKHEMKMFSMQLKQQTDLQNQIRGIQQQISSRNSGSNTVNHSGFTSVNTSTHHNSVKVGDQDDNETESELKHTKGNEPISVSISIENELPHIHDFVEDKDRAAISGEHMDNDGSQSSDDDDDIDIDIATVDVSDKHDNEKDIQKEDNHQVPDARKPNAISA